MCTHQHIEGKRNHEQEQHVVEADEPNVQVEFVVDPVADLFDDFADILLCGRVLQDLVDQGIHF